jgi:isocitrate/isopropylmalate dehydrogenase
MFEPIHGSAPKHAGKNVASPIGAILAGQMLLDHVGEPESAALVGAAVEGLFRNGMLRSTGTDSGVGTMEQGDLVREAMKRSAASPTGKTAS